MDSSLVDTGDLPPEVLAALRSKYPWLGSPPAADGSPGPTPGTGLAAATAGNVGTVVPEDRLQQNTERFRQIMRDVLSDVTGPSLEPSPPVPRPLPEIKEPTKHEKTMARWSTALGAIGELLQHWHRGEYESQGPGPAEFLRKRREKSVLARTAVEEKNRADFADYQTKAADSMRRQSEIRARVMDPAIRAISEAIFTEPKAAKPSDIETRMNALKTIQTDPSIPPALRRKLEDLIIPGDQRSRLGAADVQTAQFLMQQPWFKDLSAGEQQVLVSRVTGGAPKGGGGTPTGAKGLTVQERFLWHLNNDAFGDADEAMRLAEADVAGLEELSRRQTGRRLVSSHGTTVDFPSSLPGNAPAHGRTVENYNAPAVSHGGAGAPTRDPQTLTRLAKAYAAGKAKYPASAEDMRASFIRQYGMDPELLLMSGASQ